MNTVVPLRHSSTVLWFGVRELIILPTLPTGSRRKGSSTRQFGQHYMTQGVLLSFTDWLQTVDGKERSHDQAMQIGVDVSEYLHFFGQEVVRTHCLQALEFNRYITALQKANLQC